MHIRFYLPDFVAQNTINFFRNSGFQPSACTHGYSCSRKQPHHPPIYCSKTGVCGAAAAAAVPVSAGLAPFCSLQGCRGGASSLGSTMDTWSGRGRRGPILPLGSHGNMIFTLMPSTPVQSQWKTSVRCSICISCKIMTFHSKQHYKLVNYHHHSSTCLKTGGFRMFLHPLNDHHLLTKTLTSE